MFAVMQPGFALEIQNEKEFLLMPDAQLPGSLPWISLGWRPNLKNNLRIRRVGDVNYEYASIRVTPIRAAAHIGVVPVDSKPGVHAALEKRRVTQHFEPAGGGGWLGRCWRRLACD